MLTILTPVAMQTTVGLPNCLGHIVEAKIFKISLSSASSK